MPNKAETELTFNVREKLVFLLTDNVEGVRLTVWAETNLKQIKLKMMKIPVAITVFFIFSNSNLFVILSKICNLSKANMMIGNNPAIN